MCAAGSDTSAEMWKWKKKKKKIREVVTRNISGEFCKSLLRYLIGMLLDYFRIKHLKSFCESILSFQSK